MFFLIARQARSSDPAVRTRAATRLGAGRRASGQGELPRHVSLLLQLAGDADVGVRAAAFESLGRVADARAAQPIAAALKDIDRLGEPATTTLRDAAARAFEGMGAEAVPELVRLTNDRNAKAREAAVLALGAIGGADVERALVAALQDNRSSVRQLAARGLARTAAAGSIGSLSAALEHRDPATRRSAVEAMAGMQAPEAARALGRLTADPDRSVREAAVHALAKLDSPDAVSALLAVFQGQDREMRQQAGAALKDLDWQPVTPAQRALRAIVGGDYAAAAAEGAAAVEPLAALAGDRSTAVRRAAAEALGHTGHVAAVGPLILSLQDADESVRQAGADALVRIGAAAAVPLASAVHDAVRSAAPDIVVRIGGAAAAPLLDALERGTPFSHDGAQVRRIADDDQAEALARAAQLLGRLLARTASSSAVEAATLGRAARLADLVTVRDVMPASRREAATTIVDIVVDCTDVRARAAAELERRKK